MKWLLLLWFFMVVIACTQFTNTEPVKASGIHDMNCVRVGNNPEIDKCFNKFEVCYIYRIYGISCFKL